mmetsp:Transcript_18995/g.39900  ORF Transcript_18995/g.39900 Transcript_18995/m.39900 type:complete len:254 (+) Transcript_18995:277-1038(+)
MAFSSSPTSVFSFDNYYNENASKNRNERRKSQHIDIDESLINLEEFIEELPRVISRQKEENARKSMHERLNNDHAKGSESETDPINKLFSRLDLGLEEWKKYALFEHMKNYTRNLIATDNATFTLLLLCWNPDKESPIHDHPCDGCWLRVCEGSVRETRYEIDEVADSLEVTSDETFESGSLTFISDFMGFHKLGNTSKTDPAVTMHLYCPPFKQCKIWLDPSQASRPSNAYMCNYSEYGDKDACNLFEVNYI